MKISKMLPTIVRRQVCYFVVVLIPWSHALYYQQRFVALSYSFDLAKGVVYRSYQIHYQRESIR